jgi:hypothetical protein
MLEHNTKWRPAFSRSDLNKMGALRRENRTRHFNLENNA